MAFTDNFTAASDTNLEDHTPSGGTAWTLVSGTAGSAKINAASGTLRTTLFSDAMYICDDQGSADNYVQAVLVTLVAANSFVATRFVDASNLIGWRCTGTGAIGFKLTKNVAGTLTDLYSMQGVAGNTYKVEVTGSVAILYENGTNKSGNQTYSENTTETSTGLRTSDLATNNWIDDFEAGAIGGGGTTYTITPSGGMQYAGTATYNRGRVFSPAGGMTFAGTGIIAKTKVFAVTGGLVLGGIASYLRGKILTSSGGLQFSGTAPLQRNWLSVSGGLAFAGAVAMQFTSISAPVIRELLRLSDRVFGRRSLKQRKF